MSEINLRGNLQIRTSEGKNAFMEVVEMNKAVVEYDMRRVKIAPGTVDAPLDFGGVSDVKFAFLCATKPLTVKVNGAVAGCTGTQFLFTGSDGFPISSITCGNPGLEVADLLMVLGG